jgi:hypothetical protein
MPDGGAFRLRRCRSFGCGGGYELQLDGKPLLTVTHTLAKQSGSEPKALAQQWAYRLRQALAWQWLAVPLTEAVIAVGEEVIIPLLGNAVGSVQVEAMPSEPVRWRIGVEKQASFVVVRGMEVGSGILRIVKGNVGVRLPFRILHRAGRWREAPVAWGRGEKIGRAMVWEAVENAVLTALQLQLGAQWQIFPTPDGQLPPFVKPNEALTCRVQVIGEQLLPVDDTLTIPLRSFPSSLGDADLLVISNDPETFRDLSGALSGSFACRSDRAVHASSSQWANAFSGAEFGVAEHGRASRFGRRSLQLRDTPRE